VRVGLSPRFDALPLAFEDCLAVAISSARYHDIADEYGEPDQEHAIAVARASSTFNQ
jgi:hypothetical protein